MKFTNNVIKQCKVKIGNLDWQVKLVDDKNKFLYDLNANPKESSVSDSAMGMCYKNLCEIYISSNMTKGNMKRTITHELTHAVLYTYGLLASKNELDEEEICNFMEIHLEEIRKLASNCIRELSIQ